MASYEPTSVDDRKYKHLALDESITSIWEVHRLILNLHGEILGEPKPEPALNVEKQQPPSLVQVLDSGPDRIHQACEECMKALAEVREKLF